MIVERENLSDPKWKTPDEKGRVLWQEVTSTRPFQCDICGRRFSDVGIAETHDQVVHGA